MSASNVKILAAVPGAANNTPPVRSTNPIFLIADAHLTVFLVAAEGDAVTMVPVFAKSKVLLMRIGIFFETSGSKVRG